MYTGRDHDAGSAICSNDDRFLGMPCLAILAPPWFPFHCKDKIVDGIRPSSWRPYHTRCSHFVQSLHEVVVDLVVYDRVVFVSRVRGDKVTDPSSRRAKFSCTTPERSDVARKARARVRFTLSPVLDEVQIGSNLASSDVIDIERVQVGVDDSHQTGE